MNILHLTPGTGSFYCGSCLRDNALGSALSALGHDVTMVPLYLPFALESVSIDTKSRVFLGGINMFIRQRFPKMATLLQPLSRALDKPRLLKWAASHGDMTDASTLGEMTVATLRLEKTQLAKELDKLLEWIQDLPKPDVICLSNVMLSAIARRLKEDTGASITCSLQGEAPFLDALPEPYQSQAWGELRESVKSVDHFIAVSQYYGSHMAERLAIPESRIRVIPNGISLDDYAPPGSRLPKPPLPTIGYLARMCKDKGLDRLIDAFILLKKNRVGPLHLRVCGVKLSADDRFVRDQQAKLIRAGLEDSVDFLPNAERCDKLAFLKTLSVLSVPAPYGESFGLYLLEAMASGVPVVQPDTASFPEIIRDTGGGLLCDAHSTEDLARILGELIDDRPRARELAEVGRRAVFERYSSKRMAEDVVRLFEEVTSASLCEEPKSAATSSEPLGSKSRRLGS